MVIVRAEAGHGGHGDAVGELHAADSEGGEEFRHCGRRGVSMGGYWGYLGVYRVVNCNCGQFKELGFIKVKWAASMAALYMRTHIHFLSRI